MRILGFCEGARADSGGVGLIGVPLIHRAMANQGHRDVLVIGGDPMPSAEGILRSHINDVFDSPDDSAIGAVAFPAWGRWSFSPELCKAAFAGAERTDFVTLHSLFSFPVLTGYAAARRFGVPFGLWPHGVFAPVQRDVGKTKKAAYGAVIANRILREASVLFYSATGERDEALPLNLRTPSVIIPHGIDTTPFAATPARDLFRRKFIQGKRGPLVLYLGRLNTKKGLDLLVDAMARVLVEIPDATLVVAGGGHPPAFVEQLRRWIAKARIGERTVITGRLDETDKIAALHDCDVFVLPSAAENFGFAMFEAMAAGKPIVCSDTLNYADDVRACEAGLVVRRTATDVAHAIVHLLRNPTLCQALGQNGMKLAANYSWDACGQRVEVAINCVLHHEGFPADLKPA